MSRNGAGVYNLVNGTWFPPVTGVLATATDWSVFIQDIASALTQSVSSDGQTPMTGNLAMGNNKITGLAVGTASTDAVNVSQVNSNAGQCRLVKSGANLVLQPFQGNRLTINGVVFTIPSAGVSLAPAGTTPLTLYYIYAFMVGAVMTLEFSTTTHATDTATGVEIKSGDATRTLVGMARPIAGPVWMDTSAQRFVVSWFNRRPINTLGVFTANRTTTNTGFVELNTEIRNEFLSWASDAVSMSISGSVTNNTNGGAISTSIAYDSSTSPSEGNSFTSNQPGTNSLQFAVALTNTSTLAEGFHFATLVGATVGGGSTALWVGNVTQGTRTALAGLVFG